MLTLSDAQLTLKIGDYGVLDYTVQPANATVEWTSSDPEVATVNDGIVHALAMGYTEIKAKADNKTAICDVYVTDAGGGTLALNSYVVEMQKGGTYQLECTNTYALPLTWRSTNPDIISVDDNGLLTAQAAGEAEIWVAAGSDSLRAVAYVKHQWGEYKLVWSDEFEGNALDENNWNIETNIHVNNELQQYTEREQNLRVSNGNLEIEARKETYNNYEYTSGRINSRNKQQWTYGKMEARIKWPAGRGTWPAFWMLGTKNTWPKCGEIDIVEYLGSQPTRASFAVHTYQKNGNGKPAGNWSSVHFFDYNLYEDYHIYGVEWLKEEEQGCDKIIFTVDGVEYASVTEDIAHINEINYWPFQNDNYIILNLAIGGNLGGTVDTSIFNKDVIMYVDWVRVYQREEL